VFFGFDKLQKNILNIKTNLKKEVYQNQILPPTTPWIDKVAPKMITNLVGKVTKEGILLTWDDPASNYSNYYAIYRSLDKDFEKVESKYLLATVKRKYGLKFLDKSVENNKKYYYKITPVDKLHNEGIAKEKIIF
ncbi:MAG: hypothetical protein ACRC68_18075, partial [Clostridium sp.]